MSQGKKGNRNRLSQVLLPDRGNFIPSTGSSGNTREVNLICSYYQRGECRSCGWIELPYAEQLSKKESLLKSALQLENSNSVIHHPAVASSVDGFRNRAKMIVTGTSDHPIIGLTGEETLDHGRELLHCPIHHPQLNEVIAALPHYIREFNLIPYRIGSRTGELKGLILFHSPLSGETYLRFVLRSKECISRIQKLLPKLQKQFPHVKSVSANLQPIPHAILEGKEEIFITEQKFIEHRFQQQNGTLSLQLAPSAFVQTNVEVATKLYETAASWIAKIKPKKMLELFSGQGAFSFFAAESASEILGIEINESAVKTANETAREKGLTHVSFLAMDAKLAPSIGADLILVNPPRRGLAESVSIILNSKPQHLLYSSCAVDTLAKDIQILEQSYTLKEVRIFDLFPHTEHFETLVRLERKATP